MKVCYNPCMPFFLHSPKKVLEFVNLTKTLETKGLKLWNIKTCSISMLIPLKHVSRRYKSLIVKMHINAPKSELVRESLDLLCDFS